MTGHITFASPSGAVDIHELERARCAHICHGITSQPSAAAPMAAADIRHRYAHLVDPGHEIHTRHDVLWVDTFRRWMLDPGYHDVLRVPGEEHISPFSVAMNTMLTVGSSVIELMARVHATCGIHGYVLGEHRAWLADIVEEGVATYQLTGPAGWANLVEFLRSDDTEPVVMSESSVAGWPNGMGLEAFTGDEGRYLRDDFTALSIDDQWAQALPALIAADTGIDLSPDIWGKRGFGNGWTIFDLENWLDTRV